MNLKDALRDPRRYEEQIDRLQQKYLQRNRLYDLAQEGVPLASICLDKKKVSRLLAESVSTGNYELPPANIRWQEINKKRRQLYVYRITDLIVHAVVASIINEAMQPIFSPQLFSYRKGTHWGKALSSFARYIRTYRRHHPDLKTRGLYLIRRDVHKYTDSIPVHDQSEIWALLKKILSINLLNNKLYERYWQLIIDIVRPEIYCEDGLLYQNVRGVPTGSPISTTLFNLYLMSMDNELDKVPGAFYARYSDDFLFVHPDPDEALRISDRIDTILSKKGLRANKEKAGDIFFNGPGRPAPITGNFLGAANITFLGCNISFEGVVSLKKEKVRQLLKNVTSCARRTYNALDNKSLDVAGPIVCSVISKALDPDSSLSLNSTLQLRKVVTNRHQLKDLDYKIARIVIRVMTGDSNIRAFRQIKYRTLRMEWNLVSLLHTRNSIPQT
jgi:retron-type reverse transcriptase